jgi:very-short-patch-repair endonuclease
MTKPLMEDTTSDIQPLVSDKKPGVPGFLQTLAGYYAQFLETDFKKSREPKRKYLNRDPKGNRAGLRTEKYPSFRKILVDKLGQEFLTDFLIQPNKYRSSLPESVKAGLKAAINTISTEPLLLNISDIEQDLRAKYNLESDLEKVVEETAEEFIRLVERQIVAPVIELLSPIVERQHNDSVALEQLLTYSEELSQLIAQEAVESLPTACSELLINRNNTVWLDLAERFVEPMRVREILFTYFSEFSASDAFIELREILASKQLSENAQTYLNFGEISNGKSRFPLYFIPINAEPEKSGIRLSFETHLFVNKKAVEYIIGELAKATNQAIPNPLNDRIFYKDDSETYLNVALETFHKILLALQVKGEVDLGANGSSIGVGPGFKVTNDISLSLCDKSDESIVNDYEALMTDFEGGSDLLNTFRELIENFLTTNPLSIESDIDIEWQETATSDRLVFQSPLPLAEEQRKVLSAIRNTKSRFIAVEGPPGTGKSHTISAIAFEMILRNESILILSDKMEALDVVESKLNSVIARVRGNETEYVNPILRLGKTNSNFSNIVKRNSIQKLRTSLHTFKGRESQFNSTLQNLEIGLKAHVENRIEKAQNIPLEEIRSFFDDEAEMLNTFPVLDQFDDRDEADLKSVISMHSLLNSSREILADLLDEHQRENLKQLSEVNPILSKKPESLQLLAKKYPNLLIERAGELKGIANQIEDLRIAVFGYIFAGNKLKKIGFLVEEIVGVHTVKPQELLPDLLLLSKIDNDLSGLLKQFNVRNSSFLLLYRALSHGFSLPKSDAQVITDYLIIDQDRMNELSIPHSITDLFGLSESQQDFLNRFTILREKESKLANAFSQLPKFDYLKDKTDLEMLNATKLTNRIDERVVNFVEKKRADAKTLQKIISSKGKFPTKEFGSLKEAFPCIIAGLRDYAEFIPLEANLFDLVIIDEASQVSIAQALPAILRAKKMIVMGDRRQFGNVKTANASKALNSAYFSQVQSVFDETVALGDVGMIERSKILNITNSVMDFFELVSNFSIQLKKHFRGYPEMISFSSKYFYEESLQALKIRGKPIEEVLEFVYSDDPDQVEVQRNANEWEASVIIERLESLIKMEDPPSVAVITPFREQQSLVASKVANHPRYQDFRRLLKFAAYTFDTCQGEERDIIFYSMAATRAHDRLNHIFPKDLYSASEDEIESKLRFQRLNVGFSRGKEKLVFILSKPLDEYKGSVRQALSHYSVVLDSAHAMPSVSQVDPNSPMEAKLLEWLKGTSFVTSNLDNLEILPQFEIGSYLRALDPSYNHPAYKVDFLLRLRRNEEVLQVIVEYDGFEFHFQNRDQVDATNWKHFLNEADIERECILESYGYKMLRVNRFNIGKDPVSMLDRELKILFGELSKVGNNHEVVAGMQTATNENIAGLENGTHKKCSLCDRIKPKEDFHDKTLKSKFGRNCKSCKGGKRARGRSRRPARW